MLVDFDLTLLTLILNNNGARSVSLSALHTQIPDDKRRFIINFNLTSD